MDVYVQAIPAGYAGHFLSGVTDLLVYGALGEQGAIDLNDA
jgi:hypothetical protein